MTKARRLAYLALTLNAIIWGAAFPIIKPALDVLSATEYLYLRFLVAGIVALPIFLYFFFQFRPRLSYLLKVLLIELGGTVIPLLILYEGLARTSALEASLIGATGPIFIVLGGMWVLGERETKREWQGLALSLFGSLLIVSEPLLTNRLETTVSMTGNLLILSYNLLNTAYVITAKKVYKKKPPFYLGSLTYLVTALVYALVLSRQSALPSLSLLITNFPVSLAVLYMAIPGTILAFLLYLYGQSKIEVSEMSLFSYLNGVLAIPTAYLLLGESPSLLNLVAITIIAYGVYRAETRYTRAKNNNA